MVLGTQALLRGFSAHAAQLASERAERAPELDRAAGALAAPERDLSRTTGRGGDEHAIACDALDAPTRRTELEDLAGARLVDHLLVELAHAPTAVGEVHAVEATVGDRAGVGDGERARAVAPVQHIADAIPRDARAQLGELVGRVAAGQHVEHAFELGAWQVTVRRGALHERLKVADRPVLTRAHRDDLLREHVEWVLWHADVFDRALVHALHDHGALDEIATVLGKDPPAARGVDRVAGAADALQAARHAARRLDLDHEIDRAHVDAELE